MADRQRRQVIDPVRSAGGERPGHGRSPVVPDDVGLRRAGRVEHGGNVGDEMVHRVGLDLGRLVRAPVPAQVRDDDLEAGVAERGDLMAPQASGVREAVQQDHRPALAGHLVLDPDPV